MDKESRILLWEKMSKQNVSIEDLQCYSLDDLKKLDSLLDSFFENFRKTTSTGEEKVIRVAYDLIIWVIFTSIISFIGILVGISSYKERFHTGQFICFGFMTFVVYNLISRIVNYSENKALYDFIKSEFYQDNRKNLHSSITFLEKIKWITSRKNSESEFFLFFAGKGIFSCFSADKILYSQYISYLKNQGWRN